MEDRKFSELPRSFRAVAAPRLPSFFFCSSLDLLLEMIAISESEKIPFRIIRKEIINNSITLT